MASMGHKHRQRDQKQRSLNLQEAQIEQIKEEVAKRVTSQLTVSRSKTFSGPYPPPKYADEYEKIYPGFLKKTIELAETEQSNYYKTIKRRDWQDFGVKIASLVIVFAFICVTVGGGIYLLLQNKDIAGYVSMIGGLAAVIWAINNKKEDKSN